MSCHQSIVLPRALTEVARFPLHVRVQVGSLANQREFERSSRGGSRAIFALCKLPVNSVSRPIKSEAPKATPPCCTLLLFAIHRKLLIPLQNIYTRRQAARRAGGRAGGRPSERASDRMSDGRARLEAAVLDESAAMQPGKRSVARSAKSARMNFLSEAAFIIQLASQHPALQPGSRQPSICPRTLQENKFPPYNNATGLSSLLRPEREKIHRLRLSEERKRLG